VRTMLRAILTSVLLLGSGVADWALVPALAHESCCCGTPAGAEDRCPCPKPEGNRSPSQSPCPNRPVSVASLAVRQVQSERRIEPRPEPATWAEAFDGRALSGSPTPACGRDPDLGRHLARLKTLLI
jgi:hypothetical protein